MDEFEFQDPQFISASPSQLNLSIQIASEFISFAVQEKPANKLLYLKHIPYEPLKERDPFAERIEKIIHSDAKLSGSFVSSKMMWISEKYSLVPREYSDEQYLKKLFQVVHPLDELEELNLMDLQETGYKLLFSLPQELVHELKKQWPDISFFHQLIPLHQANKTNIGKAEGFSVYLQVYPEFCDIIVYQNGMLKLANSFPFQEKTDLIYHLINIFTHFEIDPLTGSLTVSDHYFHGLSGADALKKYFQNVHFEKPHIPDGNLSIFEAQDLSRYVNLLNLTNCV
jgi:hypothetical protein